ncbi:ORF1 protein [Armillaria mellea negative-stranded RNA virus 1]|uniref:ORF1 protein n=1 Tax=Armillaria mellea negative-stranded RNA virus 1 TaxID=2827439 RepID=A0AAX1MD40_9MONO|nr:ORF1 protein [Armillaria mellea negative-stranded RNA virus 1]QUD20349.1 ORF1 protein [Armillaria mellea negative-stranded RNA virus 1]
MSTPLVPVQSPNPKRASDLVAESEEVVVENRQAREAGFGSAQSYPAAPPVPPMDGKGASSRGARREKARPPSKAASETSARAGTPDQVLVKLTELTRIVAKLASTASLKDSQSVADYVGLRSAVDANTKAVNQMAEWIGRLEDRMSALEKSIAAPAATTSKERSDSPGPLSPFGDFFPSATSRDVRPEEPRVVFPPSSQPPVPSAAASLSVRAPAFEPSPPPVAPSRGRASRVATRPAHNPGSGPGTSGGSAPKIPSSPTRGGKARKAKPAPTTFDLFA